ncbi:energy-coupling factor ABC transporter ATP-binding protein [Rhodobacter ferrooxidans]|uniref:ABC transporter related protein n=1 Tax=Rhodobacter ferrooxidans TaxID=371731 RepID=C8S1I3_9RHOB|nr:ABC transporter ATP-binding protein [Rhodobacter sp. SW2]EEW25156.1 ABC transporter related protein [Rhodobacter sp. SW2]
MPHPFPGITLTDASYSVAGKTILPGLTLSLTEPRIGIVGRNGSGKTTLLRLLAGLVAPTSGTVRLGGFDPAKDRKAALAALGILFQNPDHQIIFPTVEEELAFGLRQQGRSDAEARAMARETLTQHGRLHWAPASVATLSQGQRHYLCLMAVLAMQPATILLDEPFAGLDLPTQTRLIRALQGLPQRLITISHDPALLQGYDRVIWLEDGHVRQDGPAAAVLPEFHAEMARLGGLDADADLTG